MPAHVSCGSLKDKIPLDWTSIDIASLTNSTDLSKRYIQLFIQHCYKYHQLKVSRLKLLLTDGQDQVIDFFAMGQVADDLQSCEKGDTLLCLEFEVENSLYQSKSPCLIVADDTGQQKSLIWISKPKAHAVPSTSRSVAVRPTSSSPTGKKHLQCESPKRSRQKLSYSYKMLSDIQVNTIVDVYGVVKFVKPPVKGKGSDHYCVIGLVDPSLVEKSEEKLTCVLFNRESDKLPQVEEGDILRLHRLKIQSYQGSKQGYNGPGFQWLAFHGSLDSISFSSPSYTFENQDKKRVTDLLKWWSEEGKEESHPPTVAAAPRKPLLTLADVKPKRYFDIACQVVQVCELDPDICRLVRVWDGTRIDEPVKTMTDNELNMSLREDKTLVQASQGLTVDVFLFDGHARESSDIQPGDFLLLTNLHSAVVHGLVEMTLHGGGLDYCRGCQVLPSDSSEAQTIQQRLRPLLNVSLNCKASERRKRETEPGPSREVLRLEIDSSDNSKDNSNVSLRSDRTMKGKVRSAYPVIPVVDESLFCGRKDVASKNKSLRFRIKEETLGLRSFLTSVDEADLPAQQPNVNVSLKQGNRGHEEEVGVDERNTSCYVEPQEGRSSPFKDAGNDFEDVLIEDEEDSSSDESQSIWLSVYNDPDFASAQTINKTISKRKMLPQGKFSSTCSISLLRYAFGKGLKPKSDSRKTENSTFRTKTSVRALIMGSGMLKEILSDDEDSSQGSFVTAPSPDMHMSTGHDLLYVAKKDIKRDRRLKNPHGICSGSGKKRPSEESASEADKKLKLSCTVNEDNSHLSREEEEQKKEKLDVPLEMRDDKEPLSQEETFSQRHLEILESVLSFATEEFTQETLHKRNNNFEACEPAKATVVEETQLEQLEPTLRSESQLRQSKVEFETTSSQGFTINTVGHLKTPNQSSQSTRHKKDEAQVSEKTEKAAKRICEPSQVCQDRQNIQQKDSQAGDSQVSSSTDSPNSQSHSQPRCMLRTASVVINNAHVSKSSLQQVLEHPPPFKFRIQARVQSLEPRPVGPEDLVHLFCSKCKFFNRMSTALSRSVIDKAKTSLNCEQLPCPQCVQSSSDMSSPTLRPITVLILQLSDGKCNISASLWDRNADQFFCGFTPQQLLTNRDSFLQVQGWLSDLCPLGSSLDDRPVLECCVCNYHVEGDIKFQIFDTTLVQPL